MSFRQRITEQIMSVWGPLSWSGLRSRFKIIGSTFFGGTPAYDNTIVSYKTARELYSNINDSTNLAGFFSKPIVDLQVDFIGHPVASTDDEDVDDFLNKCLHVHWSAEIQQMLRNAIRDSKTIVRIQQDPFDVDPLMTIEESMFCRLEIIDPDY